jgi:hypothetical protein
MPHKSEVVFPCLQQHAFRVIQLAILVWATTAHNSTEVTRRLTKILLRKTTTLYNLTKKKHQEGHTFSFVGGSSSIPALLNPQCWPVVIIQWWRTSSRNGGEATVVGSGLLYWLRFYLHPPWEAGVTAGRWIRLQAGVLGPPGGAYGVSKHLSMITTTTSGAGAPSICPIWCPQGRICNYQSPGDLEPSQECVLEVAVVSGKRDCTNARFGHCW